VRIDRGYDVAEEQAERPGDGLQLSASIAHRRVGLGPKGIASARSTTPSLLANIALATKARRDWDARAERLTSSDPANES
jgi:hypothetical protein